MLARLEGSDASEAVHFFKFVLDDEKFALGLVPKEVS